jgi:hypothetical protein
VLAPKPVSVWLPTFHDPVFPLYTRPNYMATLRWHLGDDDVQRRELLTQWVGQGSSGYRGAIFQQALRYYRVRVVAVDRRAPRYTRIRRDLAAAGFAEHHNGNRLAIWVRSADSGAGGP